MSSSSCAGSKYPKNLTPAVEHLQLDVYTQAVNSNKRAAQSKVVKMMIPNLGEMKDEKTLSKWAVEILLHPYRTQISLSL